MKIIIAYIPVLHAGYMAYLRFTGAKVVYALEPSDVPELPQLSREIRRLSIDDLTAMLAPLGYEVKAFSSVSSWKEMDAEICMPKDDATLAIQKRHFQGRDITWESWFLRWDWSNSTSPKHVEPVPDRTIFRKDLDWEMDMYASFAKDAAHRSSDWWRQVGCVAVSRFGSIFVGYNRHYPSEDQPYFDGDPRDNFNPGEFIEVSTAFHGERAVIAEAAKKGTSLLDATLFVTTFPCNDCANMIAAAGIGRVLYLGGYSNLKGYETLKGKGVEIIKVID